ncbi:putative DNA repair protein [Trypanosoma rangeli]|uniref:Putative DNA repair protein n=1 Tax=Trypanosoma rangeli TaxID=5698 RepID=A0A422NTR3_TRYRA|nr:putative DNA repair protein [Trypanosoma rangeli]RNF08847.1 putative DNA repair protein [Trypanosoma rangeli]|eukprot:RNF08847.1 putative DNA repair protein [Trypanosoma rangeli]
MLPTIASQIAECCAGQDMDDINAQLCVVSIGFDVEGIVSRLIRCALAGLSSLHACISCVVLPDGTRSGTLSRVASALRSSLNKIDGESLQVHVAEEGTSTRIRCTYYQGGGVVVLSSRMLCADLLHRRLSRELVGIAIVLLPYGGPKRSDSVVPSIAFCAEILLRGGCGGAMQLLSRRRHPPFIILSDNPCFVRYLLQRRRIGQEPFLTKLHVDDVQLFPRFRLNVMRHFEELAKERPLKVERVAVGASPSTTALDGMLRQVLKEVIGELHALETRLGQISDHGHSHSSRNVHTTSADRDAGDPYLRLQPISRRPRLEKQPPRYVRKPWVVPSDPTVIRFGCICEEDALDVVDVSLDDDLDHALRANGPLWPFSRLVESLLDVRGLRRDVRRISPFAWLFALEASLVARTARYTRDVSSARAFTVQPPDAPWTLSQHFSSIVTLAIHRVGTVETRLVTKNNIVHQKNGNDTYTDGSHLVVESAETSSDDEEVVCVEPETPQRLLLPRSDEVDPCMEYANRVIQGWCRDARRRGIAKDLMNPVFLLIVFGERALRRYVCRLTHLLEDFQTFELNGFVAAYQAKHGADIRRCAEGPVTEKSTGVNLRTWFLAGNDDVIEEEGKDRDEDEDGASEDGAQVEKRGMSAPSQSPSFLFSQGSTVSINPSNSNKGNHNADNISLHQLLLSQAPLTPPSEERQQEQGSCQSGPLSLECVGSGIALLRATCADGDASSVFLQVAVVDGSLLCASELITMLEGSHNAFTLPTRLLVVEQHLRFLRLLEMAQDALRPERLRELRVQVLVEQLHDSSLTDRVVEEEREAFKALAHAKATLTGSLLADRSTLRVVQDNLESGLIHDHNLGRRQGGISGLCSEENCVVRASIACGSSTTRAAAEAPLVVFDEREFRSLLPYALYRRGIELVPLTLTTADYVLSPSYALERKSAPDFIQSLLSGRIYTQLAALSRRYEFPLCLVEFDCGAPFRLSFSSSFTSSPSPAAESGGLFARVARLFAAFPRVQVLWSRDATQSAAIIHEMKRTCAREGMDPSAPSLTRANIDPHDTAMEKETAHLAARVLSCFPGITPGNTAQVMAVCGSLVGLATIDESALVGAMGEENAKRLYSFLHGDLVAKAL